MESISLIQNRQLISDLVISGVQNALNHSGNPGKPWVNETISFCLNEDFQQYISRTGLVKESGYMILSSVSRYYYDLDDFEGIKTLINLKELNHIPHLDSFLFTLYKLSSPGTLFLGCFKAAARNGRKDVNTQYARRLNGYSKMCDKRTGRSFTEEGATHLLEAHGFKVLDLTELKGTIYFCTRIMKRTGE